MSEKIRLMFVTLVILTAHVIYTAAEKQLFDSSDSEISKYEISGITKAEFSDSSETLEAVVSDIPIYDDPVDTVETIDDVKDDTVETEETEGAYRYITRARWKEESSEELRTVITETWENARYFKDTIERLKLLGKRNFGESLIEESADPLISTYRVVPAVDERYTDPPSSYKNNF